MHQVSQQLPRKTLLIGIFSIIQSICCCHLVVYYLPKPLWNCVSASQICCSGSLCNCQYDPIYREFQSADSPWPFSSGQAENSTLFFEVKFYFLCRVIANLQWGTATINIAKKTLTKFRCKIFTKQIKYPKNKKKIKKERKKIK